MKIIKSFLKKFITKVINYYKDKFIINSEYIFKNIDKTEIICKIQNFDFLSNRIYLTKIILSNSGINFCDYIKIVFDNSEKFNSAYMASAISLENLHSWKIAASQEQKMFIRNLIYLTLLAREFQENKYFLGTIIFSKKRIAFLKKQTEEILEKGWQYQKNMNIRHINKKHFDIIPK